jgi:nitroreductase
MEFYDVIRNRRSIRRFKPDEIPDNLIIKLLEAARWAPSWRNAQCWEFIVVKDKAIIKQLTQNGFGKIFNAPVYIIAGADPAKSGKRAGIDYYIADVANAFENLLLAATAESLGTCWIGGLFKEDHIRQILNIPSRLRIIAITPLGYPAEDWSAKVTKLASNLLVQSHSRKELPEFCHLDRFGNHFPKNL